MFSVIMDEYLDPSIWNVQISNEDVSETQFESTNFERRDLLTVQTPPASLTVETVITLRSNVVLVCLLLEGISNSAKVLRFTQ